MKIKSLSLGKAGVIVGISVIGVIMSCNNSDKQGTNSTTESTQMNTDTVTTVPDNTKNADTATHTSMNPTAGKRIGKVTIATPVVDKGTAMKTDKGGYYNYTETAPSYTGGQSSLETYMNNNVQYPQDAIDNGIEGTVQVMFTIDENGKVSNAKVTGAALGYGLEDEAIRVVNGMTGWTPGMNKGKKVKGWYTLPITFRLEG